MVFICVFVSGGWEWNENHCQTRGEKWWGDCRSGMIERLASQYLQSLLLIMRGSACWREGELTSSKEVKSRNYCSSSQRSISQRLCEMNIIEEMKTRMPSGKHRVTKVSKQKWQFHQWHSWRSWQNSVSLRLSRMSNIGGAPILFMIQPTASNVHIYIYIYVCIYVYM